MKRLFSFLAALLFFTPLAARAQYTAVTDVHIVDPSTGNLPLAFGTLCFTATDQNNNPLAFNLTGVGQIAALSQCAPIQQGTVTPGLSIPDPQASNPYVLYRITATKSNGPQPSPPVGPPVMTYLNADICPPAPALCTTFDFGAYIPNINTTAGSSFDQATVQYLTVTGSCTLTGATGCGGNSAAMPPAPVTPSR